MGLLSKNPDEADAEDGELLEEGELSDTAETPVAEKEVISVPIPVPSVSPDLSRDEPSESRRQKHEKKRKHKHHHSHKRKKAKHESSSSTKGSFLDPSVTADPYDVAYGDPAEYGRVDPTMYSYSPTQDQAQSHQYSPSRDLYGYASPTHERENIGRSSGDHFGYGHDSDREEERNLLDLVGDNNEMGMDSSEVTHTRRRLIKRVSEKKLQKSQRYFASRSEKEQQRPPRKTRWGEPPAGKVATVLDQTGEPDSVVSKVGRGDRDDRDRQMTACRYWVRGRCERGADCTFSHPKMPKKPEVCRFYSEKGRCRDGPNCRYMHEDYPCRFYHIGNNCFREDNCRFSHDPLTPETEAIIERFTSEAKFGTNASSENFMAASDQPTVSRPSLLGSPPRHLQTSASNTPTRSDRSKKIPSLFDIKVEPPKQKGIADGSSTSSDQQLPVLNPVSAPTGNRALLPTPGLQQPTPPLNIPGFAPTVPPPRIHIPPGTMDLGAGLRAAVAVASNVLNTNATFAGLFDDQNSKPGLSGDSVTGNVAGGGPPNQTPFFNPPRLPPGFFPPRVPPPGLRPPPTSLPLSLSNASMPHPEMTTSFPLGNWQPPPLNNQLSQQSQINTLPNDLSSASAPAFPIPTCSGLGLPQPNNLPGAVSGALLPNPVVSNSPSHDTAVGASDGLASAAESKPVVTAAVTKPRRGIHMQLPPRRNDRTTRMGKPDWASDDDDEDDTEPTITSKKRPQPKLTDLLGGSSPDPSLLSTSLPLVKDSEDQSKSDKIDSKASKFAAASPTSTESNSDDSATAVKDINDVEVEKETPLSKSDSAKSASASFNVLEMLNRAKNQAAQMQRELERQRQAQIPLVPPRQKRESQSHESQNSSTDDQTAGLTGKVKSEIGDNKDDDMSVKALTEKMSVEKFSPETHTARSPKQVAQFMNPDRPRSELDTSHKSQSVINGAASSRSRKRSNETSVAEASQQPDLASIPLPSDPEPRKRGGSTSPRYAKQGLSPEYRDPRLKTKDTQEGLGPSITPQIQADTVSIEIQSPPAGSIPYKVVPITMDKVVPKWPACVSRGDPIVKLDPRLRKLLQTPELKAKLAVPEKAPDGKQRPQDPRKRKHQGPSPSSDPRLMRSGQVTDHMTSNAPPPSGGISAKLRHRNLASASTDRDDKSIQNPVSVDVSLPVLPPLEVPPPKPNKDLIAPLPGLALGGKSPSSVSNHLSPKPELPPIDLNSPNAPQKQPFDSQTVFRIRSIQSTSTSSSPAVPPAENKNMLSPKANNDAASDFSHRKDPRFKRRRVGSDSGNADPSRSPVENPQPQTPAIVKDTPSDSNDVAMIEPSSPYSGNINPFTGIVETTNGSSGVTYDPADITPSPVNGGYAADVDIDTDDVTPEPSQQIEGSKSLKDMFRTIDPTASPFC